MRRPYRIKRVPKSATAWGLMACALLCVAAWQAVAASAKPNFILILADDMGYGDIGPFGSTKNRTPNLDRLAREGMRLTSFYAAPVCTPSRAQILTGCYAKRVSLPNVLSPAAPIGLNSREHTIAELLKRRVTPPLPSANGTWGMRLSFCRRTMDSTVTSGYHTRMTWVARPI